MERVQVRAVSLWSAPACGGALSDCSGVALVTHPCDRYEEKSEAAHDCKSDSAAGCGGEDWLQPTAHDSLRTRRHLPERAGRAQRRWSRRNLRPGSLQLRASGPLGGRSWSAILWLRLRVAPGT